MTEIRQQIKQAGGIDRLKEFLAKIDPLFMPNGPYIFGARVRWVTEITCLRANFVCLDDMGRCFPLPPHRGSNDCTGEHVYQYTDTEVGQDYGTSWRGEKVVRGHLGCPWPPMILVDSP